jgi:hypothetical protein
MLKAATIVDSLLSDDDDVDPKALVSKIAFRKPYEKSINKLRNKNGTLSNYGFACGYTEEVEIVGVRLQLWKEGLWQVRAHDHRTGQRLFWESFDKKSDAIAFYKAEFKRLKTLEKQADPNA